MSKPVSPRGFADGGVATATVTVQMVEVTGWQLERQKLDETWVGVPNNGDGLVDAGEIVWASDRLRWTADYNASSLAPFIIQTDWRARPWSNPTASWQTFAYGDLGAVSALGAPGVGDWAVAPEIRFGAILDPNGYIDQSGFVAQMAQAPRQDIAKIQSVEWVGVDPDPTDNDDATNLYPPEMGGGWRVFPGKNSMDAGAPSHRAVKVKITVLPAMQDIPIKLKLYDPDDPTYADGPVDADPNTNDNRGDPLNFKVGEVLDATTTEIENGEAIAWKTFLVSLNPGDNFRVAAAEREIYFDYIKVISSQTAPETRGRLYVDKNENDNLDPGEPAVDENSPASDKNGVDVVFSTPLLTVWRRLHVEVDSMGAPPAGTQFTQEDPAPAGPNGAVPRPNTDKLDDAFHNAFIDVDVLSEAEGSQSDLTFEPSWPTVAARDDYFLHNGDLGDPNDPNDTTGYRKTKDEDAMYWTAYVAGVYEIQFPGDDQFKFNHDNDGEGEVGALGFTPLTPDEPEYSMIAMETIRDVAAEYDWSPAEITHIQQLVTIHEIGHQFGLKHPSDHPLNDPYKDYKDADAFPGSVMTFPGLDDNNNEGLEPQVALEFAEWAIAELRDNFGSGQKP
jgi:hypothetical protein